MRSLDLVDAVDPNQDLIALYTRINNNNFQIRIDFLDLVSSLDQDVYIPIDTNPGGTNQIVTQNNGTIQADINWDYLIIYHEDGKFQIVNSNYFRLDDIEIFILINSYQDNIILSINQKSLPVISPFTKIQVITTTPNKSYITDQIGPIYIDGPSPPRAKVLFVFWDIFYSSTSAEAIRSWAGAHSGPVSSRHGLKYLLDFADKTYNPIFLLDLMTPDTLSALDYLSVDDWMEKLITQGKIITNHENVDFYNYWKDSDNDSSGLVNIGYDYAHSYTDYETCFQSSVIPSDSISFSGLFNECKSRLLSNGFNKFPDPVVLGGDFQSSLLGDPAVLNNINSYIFNHPWIQVLTQYDIQTSMGEFITNLSPRNSDNVKNMLSSQSVLEDKYTFRQGNPDIYSALISAPENQLSDLAWNIFEKLSYPTASELIPLGNSYIGQIGLILTAARWVNQPEAISSCKSDLDFDGDLECILATSNIFIIIEPKGAYVPFIFSKDEQGAHQIVGPTWEFMLGISDPSTWDLSLGIRSDSAQILGAFVDDFNKWDNSEITTLNNSITFINKSLSIYKSFVITEHGVLVNFSDKDMPINGTQIPIVLDPWTRYSEDWGDKYKYQTTANGIVWKIDSGIFIEVQSNKLLTFIPFNKTRYALAKPEDPNYDYGRGHYLPFPIALIEIQPAVSYQINIVINP